MPICGGRVKESGGGERLAQFQFSIVSSSLSSAVRDSSNVSGVITIRFGGCRSNILLFRLELDNSRAVIDLFSVGIEVSKLATSKDLNHDQISVEMERFRSIWTDFGLYGQISLDMDRFQMSCLFHTQFESGFARYGEGLCVSDS